MGYTHFDKASGEQGLAVGSKGSEITVANSAGELHQKGTKITASAAELNIMDGVTASTAEINKLDGFDPRVQYLVTQVDDLSAAASIFVVMPACTVTKAWSVIHGAVDADTTLTLKDNAATAMTSGVITITATGSAAGDIDSASPTASNTFTEGQKLEIACGGEGTAAVRATITVKITRAAA